MTKKLVTEKTIEELLEGIGEETTPSETIEFRNDLLEFISVYNIKNGDEKVKHTLLYKLYSKWSKEPVTNETFNKNLKEMLQVQRATNTFYYLINISAMKINEKHFLFMKDDDKTKYKGWKVHFDKYLNFYDIKAGKYHINLKVLYNLYDKWTYKNNNRRPLGPEQFKKFCKLYFKSKRTIKGLYFAVDQQILSRLSEEQLKGLNNEKKDKKR